MKNVLKIGSLSAKVGFIAATTYSVAQIISPPLIPILKYPWNDIFIIAPSIFIPLAFVIAMNCLHSITPGEKRIWSQIGLSFAMLYAAFVGFVYIIQLATVIPFTIQGKADEVAMVALSKQHWIQAVDGFGYSLMSLATLFTFPVFAKKGHERIVRRFFIAHGLLAPFIILPLWFPPMIVIGMLWFITGPGTMFYLWKYFNEKI